MTKSDSAKINKGFVKFIDDYIADLRKFYTHLSFAAGVDEIDQWHISGFPFPEGKIKSDPDVYYLFHGKTPGNLSIKIGDQQMDIVFGYTQRIDGFSVDHLLVYLGGHAEKYAAILTRDSLPNIFEDALNQGVIKQLFINEGDYNFYKNPDFEKSD